MDIDFADMLNSLWQVLAVGLVFGAGLPALFATGMRFLGTVPEDAAPGSTTVVSTSGGRLIAYLCFIGCAAAAAFGIIVIIFGKQMFGGGH